MIIRLWEHIQFRRRIQITILIILMVIASFAEVISIGAVLPFLGVLTSPELVFNQDLIKPLINVLALSEPRQLILPLSLLFASASIISGAIRVILTWVQTRLGHAIGADLSISIYRRTLYQPYSYHIRGNTSEKITGVTAKTNSVVFYTALPALTILSSALLSFSIVAALFIIQPVMATLAFGGIGIIYIFVIFLTKKRLAFYSQSINREEELVLKSLQEGLGGIRNIIIDGTQEVYCEIYQMADLPHRRAIANVQIISNIPRYCIEALGMVLITLLAYKYASNHSDTEISIAMLGAFALSAQRLLPALQQGYSSWTMMRGGKDSLRVALDLLDQPLQKKLSSNSIPPMQFLESINISELGFRYNNNDIWVLKNINLTIPRGSRVGLTGITGSGKSTVLDIIMGLLTPTKGHLSIDNLIITEQNLSSWQRHIAHVPQVIFLADASIEENIAFGIPKDKIDHLRVRQAAERAQIALTIESWNEGYKTQVGERGVRLSGGQRQRIGIARAFYKQADVIVFDEATSALDTNTEFAVMDAIESLNDKITTIMVTHRIPTLKNCTYIYEISEGSIIRGGTYEELFGTTRL